MEWMDYREKLGIGFDDEKKSRYFETRILNVFDNALITTHVLMSRDEYIQFCNTLGIRIELSSKTNYWREVIEQLELKSGSSKEFLFACVALMHCFSGARQRELLAKIIRASLESAGISYEMIEDDEGVFFFPKGAMELDRALVSDPLEWLSKYPLARNAFVKALKKYGDATENNASDVADSFRKALESFFQEFFGSGKSLENYKSEYGNYLKEHGIPQEIANDFEKLLKSYTDFMNNYAKHHDKTSVNVLEYIMYQTGNIIRLLVTLKR